MGLKKNLIGIFLLPFCIGFLLSFVSELHSFRTAGYAELAFFSGLFIYTGIHLLLFKPRFLSTLSHESAHALWGLAFGSEIKDFRVKKESGSVSLSKTNFAIALAPYFFPTYTVLAILSSFILRKEYLVYIFFLTGLTLSLHILSTIESLSASKQPDIYKTGLLFSIPIILISNLIVIVLVLKFVSPENVSIRDFLKEGVMNTFYLLRSR